MTAERSGRLTSRWTAATAVLVIAAMGVIAAVGATQAAHGARPLGWLDAPFNFLRTSTGVLMPWLDANAPRVGVWVSAIALAMVVAAWASAGRRVVPIGWFAFSLVLGVWGEVSLLAESFRQGVAFFGLAAGSAVLFAYSYPLPGREAWLSRGSAGAAAPAAAAALGERCGVGLLTVAAFVTRVYALNELPDNFENEMVLGMLASHTLAGIDAYAPWGMLSNSNGFIHMFLQLFTFEIYGTSVFSLRLTSAIWWTLSVPLFYWLLRRIAGVGAALIGTLLLIAAPEQLFWSRCETVCIALLTPLAIVTVVLGIRLVESSRLWVLLAVAVWMPFTRYAYTPAIVLPAYLVLVYVHALLFVRGTWRTAVRVIPALAVGIGLWIGSLSFAYSLFTGSDWRFLDPAASGGAAIWQGEGAWRAEGVAALAVNQAMNMAKNAQAVGERITYRGAFDNWYHRADPSAHPTIINVGVSVALVVAIGYLMGQIRDPRAFALLVWIGLGLLPGILSQDPASRRMGLAFPGFYAAIAVTLAAALDFFRRRTGALVTWVARCVVGFGVAAIAWTSMGSHFLLPMAPTYLDDTRRASHRIFEDSDVVFYTIAPVWEEILSLVHGDEILKDDRVPCLKRVSRVDFLATALQPACDYEEVSFVYTLWPEHRQALRAAYDPQTVSFLIGEDASEVPLRELATALFPKSPSSFLRVPRTSFNVLWLQVDRATLNALRVPVLIADLPQAESAALARAALADVELQPLAALQGTGITIQGGLLIDEDGWYGIAVEPACAAVSLRIDDQPRSATALFPLTYGVHTFSLTLPGASECNLPLRLAASRFDGAGAVPIRTPVLVAPAVASLPQARARALVSGPGFQETRLPFTPPEQPLDIGADGRGVLTILSQEGSGLEIRRIGPAGNEEGRWPIADAPPQAMSVAPDGTILLVYEGRVTVYSGDGVLLETWHDPLVRPHGIGHLATGEVLSPVLENHVIAVLDRKGRLLRRWNQFEGGPGRFREPGSLAVSPTGEVLIFQLDGTALLFRTPLDRFEPEYVRSFNVDFRHESVIAVGWALDGGGRVIVPEPGFAHTFIYDLDGSRVMAADPRLDLSRVAATAVRRIVATKEGVYTLDGSNRVRRFVHVSDSPQA